MNGIRSVTVCSARWAPEKFIRLWANTRSLATPFAQTIRPLFNQHVQLMSDWFAKEQPNATKRASFEFLFNWLQPFSQSMTLYVLAFLLACASWLGWSSATKTFGVLSFAAGARHSHVRPGFAHVSAGASARHQSLFISDFHRLGCSHCRADP